jgi:hypothetical protein
MEKTFKILFSLAVFLFSLISVGVFLLIIKILLMFYPEINLLGLVIY